MFFLIFSYKNANIEHLVWNRIQIDVTFAPLVSLLIRLCWNSAEIPDCSIIHAHYDKCLRRWKMVSNLSLLHNSWQKGNGDCSSGKETSSAQHPNILGHWHSSLLPRLLDFCIIHVIVNLIQRNYKLHVQWEKTGYTFFGEPSCSNLLRHLWYFSLELGRQDCLFQETILHLVLV